MSQRIISEQRERLATAAILDRTRKPLGPVDFAACLLLPVVLKILIAKGNLFTLYQAQTQDIWVLLPLPVALVILHRRPPSWRLPDLAARPWVLLTVGTAVAALLAWCAHAWLWGFPISRDEHMVAFDMAVYAKGRLAAPLVPAWRPFAEALVPAFLINGSDPIGLVSCYLPVNALLRLGAARIADPALLNPLLALAGGIALFDIARRMFGEDRKAIAVSLLIYLLSAQVLANAMTMYAMTGHMALNLIWLAAFLRGRRAGHAVAIATGFLATGLHQLAFHPLFAAPFVFWRWRQGHWRTAVLYGVAYCAIIAAWIAFPIVVSAHTGVAAAGHGDNNASFLQRVLPLITERDPLTLSEMMLDLARFVAWQHLALLPLFLAAAPVAWRDRGPAAPMIWGIAMVTGFLALILPYQGLGWGYRYFHPYLGSFALLGGLGYRRLAASAPQKTEGMFAALSALTLFGAIPVLLWQMQEFTLQNVAIDRLVGSSKADFVLVDTDPNEKTLDRGWGINAVDEVVNDPDLTNRPLRFSSRAMDARLTAELCRRGTVSVVTWRDIHALGIGLNVRERSPRFNYLTAVLQRGGCLVDATGQHA